MYKEFVLWGTPLGYALPDWRLDGMARCKNLWPCSSRGSEPKILVHPWPSRAVFTLQYSILWCERLILKVCSYFVNWFVLYIPCTFAGRAPVIILSSLEDLAFYHLQTFSFSISHHYHYYFPNSLHCNSYHIHSLEHSIITFIHSIYHHSISFNQHSIPSSFTILFQDQHSSQCTHRLSLYYKHHVSKIERTSESSNL